MAAPRVLIFDDDIDIYALGYVGQLQNITERKTFQRDKLISDTYNLTVKNFDNFFSLDNSRSIFKDIIWLYQPFKIYNEDNILIWDGIIIDIESDHDRKLSTIKSRSTFYKFARQKISYTSGTWETPADAFKNICDAIGFSGYNQKSVQDSISQFTANSCYIKCQWNAEDDINFQQAIEKLGDISCSDVFSQKGQVYFKHYIPFTGGVKVTLTDSSFLKMPRVSILEKDIINEYSISYSGSASPVTDATSNNIGSLSRTRYEQKDLREIDGSNESDIIFKDSTSAIYIGECYIRRTQKGIDTTPQNPQPLKEIDFVLRDEEDWIDLETYCRITLTDEDWVEKLFEIFETTYNNSNKTISVVAYEVEE